MKYHYAPTEIAPSETLKLTNLLQRPPSDTKLLKYLGVKPCLKSIFYIEYILPQIKKINPTVSLTTSYIFTCNYSYEMSL